MKKLKLFLEQAFKIEGGKGKGKSFHGKETTVDDHLSAMNWHATQHQKFKKQGDNEKSIHHGKLYYKHKEQIEALGEIGNYKKD
jgi:hypothetical protein